MPGDYAEFEIDHGIRFALTGNTKEAKDHFQRVLMQDSENEEAARALKLLAPGT